MDVTGPETILTRIHNLTLPRAARILEAFSSTNTVTPAVIHQGYQLKPSSTKTFTPLSCLFLYFIFFIIFFCSSPQAVTYTVVNLLHFSPRSLTRFLLLLCFHCSKAPAKILTTVCVTKREQGNDNRESAKGRGSHLPYLTQMGAAGGGNELSRKTGAVPTLKPLKLCRWGTVCSLSLFELSALTPAEHFTLKENFRSSILSY